MKKWREDPITFVRDVFEVEPDPWQLDVLKAFPTNQRVGMKACKGPGKTCLLAWLIWNFLLTRPHPKIAATSITGDNLGDNLWPELAKWQKKSKLLTESFVWTKTRIVQKENHETWWCSARTWSRSADQGQQADTLAGLHAEYLLFVLDEVGGIPDSVMAAAEAGLSVGTETKILMAGNPTHREGPLYRACTTERRLWHITEISSDPDDPKRTPRVSKQWAREQIEKYGKDNPWVLVNVYGQFPPSSLNSLFGPDQVMRAMKTHYPLEKFDFSQKRLGIDVARFGDDRTTIFPRQGLVAFRPAIMRAARTNDIAARAIEAKNKWHSELEFIDDTGGWGAGVIDNMLTAGYDPVPINFSGKAIDPRYFNKRAEMWFLMSEWLKRGGVLPNIPELVGELCAPTYTIKNGKFLIEPKDQIKARLGNSPDLADGLALTFALPEQPASLRNRLGVDEKSRHCLHEYDPFKSPN